MLKVGNDGIVVPCCTPCPCLVDVISDGSVTSWDKYQRGNTTTLFLEGRAFRMKKGYFLPSRVLSAIPWRNRYFYIHVRKYLGCRQELSRMVLRTLVLRTLVLSASRPSVWEPACFATKCHQHDVSTLFFYSKQTE